MSHNDSTWWLTLSHSNLKCLINFEQMGQIVSLQFLATIIPVMHCFSEQWLIYSSDYHLSLLSQYIIIYITKMAATPCRHYDFILISYHHPALPPKHIHIINDEDRSMNDIWLSMAIDNISIHIRLWLRDLWKRRGSKLMNYCSVAGSWHLTEQQWT